MAGSNYTAAEVDAAVSRFVKSSVSVTKDVLGPIDTSSRFDEVMELFASTLILDPNAVFYLVFLASNKLCADVISAITLVNDILQAIKEIGYPPTRVTQTSLLSDAAAQLTNMSTILTQSRAVTQRPVSGSSIPNNQVNTPFDLYRGAVTSFTLASLKPNITNSKATDPITGSRVIIRSAQEARLSADNSLAILRTLYPDILARTKLLVGMVDVYVKQELQALALQRSLTQARGDLLSLQKSLEDPTTSDVQKTALTRDAYLRITSGLSVITGLKDTTNPTAPRMSFPVAAGGVAINAGPLFSSFAAASIMTSPGPWPLQTGVTDTLIIAEDGHTPTTYTITVDPIPHVDSNVSAVSFNITDHTTAKLLSAVGPFTIPVIGKTFYITVDGLPFKGTIGEGARTTDQVVADLNALQDPLSNPLSLSSAVTVSNSGGAVLIQCTQPGTHTIYVSDNDQVSHGYLAALGLTTVPVSGTVANNMLSIDDLIVPLTVGAARTPSNIVGDINTWAAAGPYPYHAIVASGFIEISKTGAGARTITMTDGIDDATKAAVRVAYVTLGFYIGQTDSADEVTAADLADALNLVGKVKAIVVRRHVGTNTEERVQIISKVSTLSTLLTVGAGTANTLLGLLPGVYPGTTTGYAATASFENADVEAGDSLTIYTDQSMATVFGQYVVTAVAGTQLEATPPFPTNLSSPAFRIESESKLAWDVLLSNMLTWNASLSSSHFRSDTSELDRVMNPVLVNLNPTTADFNLANNRATELLTLLTQPLEGPPGLKEILELYVVRSSARIDAAVAMLQERGFDRAYATLLGCDLAGFFSYNKDEAASASYLLQTMRSLAQNDLPITNKSTTADDTSLDSSVQTSDANFDRSDVDKDENLKLLGSVPDLDTDATVPADYYKQAF